MNIYSKHTRAVITQHTTAVPHSYAPTPFLFLSLLFSLMQGTGTVAYPLHLVQGILDQSDSQYEP